MNSQFKIAYSAYQDAVKSNDSNAQFNYATDAYQLGQKLYGDSNINTANLALILAKQHLSKQQKTRANSLIVKTLEIFKNEYGDNSAELSEIYILLGHAQTYKKREQSVRYYLRAINIAKDYEDKTPYFTAQIQLESGIGLLGKGSRKSNVILTAQKFFTEHLPNNDKRVVKANFFVGKYYLARNKYNTAIKNLQANLPVFNALEGLLTH